MYSVLPALSLGCKNPIVEEEKEKENLKTSMNWNYLLIKKLKIDDSIGILTFGTLLNKNNDLSSVIYFHLSK